MGPKQISTRATVSAVEHNIIAALKPTTRTRLYFSWPLVIRTPEKKPSTAANMIPANPPYSNTTRKMNACEAVTLVLTRGIWTVNRDLTKTIALANISKRRSNCGQRKKKEEHISATPPSATIDQL